MYQGKAVMDWNTSLVEVNSNRHPILRDSENYQIVRCTYDFDHERNDNTITLTLVHRMNGERKRLQFTGVTCDHPLSQNDGIYILDTQYRQWEKSKRIEVGEYFEDGGVYFYAEGVEEVEDS